MSRTIIELENNIFPKDVNRQLFSISDRNIIKMLQRQGNEICRNRISTEYIRKCFNRFKHGYIYRDDDNAILGFCIWKDINELLKGGERHVYTHLLLICAEETELKLGKKMLYDLEDYCYQHQIPSIRLEPVNDRVKQYYEEMGYIQVTSIPPYTMEKVLKIEYLVRNSSSIRKTRKKHR